MALYCLCGGKFQSWNAALLAAEKDAGLTGGSLSCQRDQYYYKGYPDNGVTAKVADQQIGLDDEEPGLVEDPTLVVSTGPVRKTVSTQGNNTLPAAPAGAENKQASRRHPSPVQPAGPAPSSGPDMTITAPFRPGFA